MDATSAEMAGLTGEANSFLSLLEVHKQLDELFYLHQEALLALDVRLALERLDGFERKLRPHMRYEEEVLLPVYERAGRIEGGPVVFFTGEHKRMLEFLARFREKLEGLLHDPRDLKREVISLFDQQAMFKHLSEHHDQRERNILYPTLDRVTDEAERRQLLFGQADSHRLE
jgi:hemerythrin-like domain-containing protein